MSDLPAILKEAGLRGAKVGKSGEYECVTVKPEQIVQLMRLFYDDLGMNALSCLTAVDCGDEFEMVYHLFSYDSKRTLVAKTRLPRNAPVVESVTSVYQNANWFEREVLDLFGIDFTNHPNPVRMLRRDDEEGYPLRKDYALRQRTPAVEDGD